MGFIFNAKTRTRQERNAFIRRNRGRFTFYQKDFAFSAVRIDTLRGGQMLGIPSLGLNRFLTTKFNYL
jgi:hypothetical protein